MRYDRCPSFAPAEFVGLESCDISPRPKIRLWLLRHPDSRSQVSPNIVKRLETKLSEWDRKKDLDIVWDGMTTLDVIEYEIGDREEVATPLPDVPANLDELLASVLRKDETRGESEDATEPTSEREETSSQAE